MGDQWVLLLLCVLMLSQATDPISGGAGWVGTGLLGSVLAWILFVSIPNKDKQIGKMIEDKDKLVELLVDKFSTEMASARADNKESVTKEREICERRHVEMVAEVREVKVEVAAIAQRQVNQMALGEPRGRLPKAVNP